MSSLEVSGHMPAVDFDIVPERPFVIPAHGSARIMGNVLEGKAEVKVFDINGQQVNTIPCTVIPKTRGTA